MVVNVINVLKGAFLLVTDNRRSWLDSSFCVITQHRKFEFSHHRQDKQCSGTENAAITDFVFCYSTNQSFKQPNYKSYKKDFAPASSSFFQFLYNLKINFLVDCFNGGVFPVVP